MECELTVGKLAKLAGVTTVTIRYYERCGLLPKATRSIGGYRTYPLSMVGRVRFIKNAQSLGFTLEEVQELVDLQSRSQATSQQVKSLALTKLKLIKEKIISLQQIYNSLESLTMACHGKGELEQCPILEALYQEKETI